MIRLTARREKWFVIPQDESGQAQVKILHLKPGQLAAIESKVNRIVGKHTSRGFDIETDMDPNSRALEIVKACVVDWKGFESKAGKELKCTNQNKEKVQGEYDWFYTQIEEFRAELAEEVEADEEDAEKN